MGCLLLIHFFHSLSLFFNFQCLRLRYCFIINLFSNLIITKQKEREKEEKTVGKFEKRKKNGVKLEKGNLIDVFRTNSTIQSRVACLCQTRDQTKISFLITQSSIFCLFSYVFPVCVDGVFNGKTRDAEGPMMRANRFSYNYDGTACDRAGSSIW